MKPTTQPKKRGRPVGSKNKFKSNPFTKKYKEELIRHEDRLGEWYETRQDTSPLNKKVMGSSSLEGHSDLATADYMDLLCENILEHSEEVKSWKRERAWSLVSWLKGKPDMTRGELYVAVLVGSIIGIILTNL